MAFVAVAATGSAFAADLNCKGLSGNVEEFRYSWRLKGGIRFLAGLMFPTTGVGDFKNVYPKAGDHSVHSELLITSPSGKEGGFYSYESQLDDRNSRTLVTSNGYAWGEKSRSERTIFDYAKRLARIHKKTPDEDENRVKMLPPGGGDMRDVLSAIYYLRQNASAITHPIQTTIYTDGKEYPVIFRPAGSRTFTIENKVTPAIGFEIVDAPGGKKWPGGGKVWLSADDRRLPFRIEIEQSIASLQLDLQSIESCGFLQARL